MNPSGPAAASGPSEEGEERVIFPGPALATASPPHYKPKFLQTAASIFFRLFLQIRQPLPSQQMSASLALSCDGSHGIFRPVNFSVLEPSIQPL